MDFNEMKDQASQMADQVKEQIDNAPDMSDMFTAEDINANKLAAALATFPILFWIPLVMNAQSGFGKFYANQGLILLIGVVILNILNAVLGAILGLIPLLGGVLSTLISAAIALLMLAAWLFLFINAVQGKAKELPIVGGLFKVFN